MFSMSLLCYTNIIEYVDPFDDEEYTKVVILCVDGDNLKSIQESPHEKSG